MRTLVLTEKRVVHLAEFGLVEALLLSPGRHQRRRVEGLALAKTGRHAEDQLAEYLAGSWHSGDLATIDAEGYANIVGRVKDMLIRGGENVYPREVEDFLLRHPGVQDVQVFGVPDPKYGEEVCAWLVPRRGHALAEQEIRDFCKGQIAHYKVPRYVRIVDAFPLTATGKAQKFEMRKTMIELLGLARERTA